MTSKKFRKWLDWLFGPVTRSMVRNALIHPLFAVNYRTEVIGKDVALSCTDGALIISNHVSMIDGPFLTNVAWPHARVRTCVWFKEYYRFLQWPIMVLFGAVPVGSPSQPPSGWRRDLTGEVRDAEWKLERQRQKIKSMDIMRKILRREEGEKPRFLLLFAEGGIGDGDKVVVNTKLTGAHDLIQAYPHKPVLMVTIKGLERSRLGKKRPAAPWHKKLPVTITVERFDNVSLEGGAEGLNKRFADYYNLGIPLATNRSVAA